MVNLIDFSEKMLSKVLHDLASNITLVHNYIEMSKDGDKEMLQLALQNSVTLMDKFRFFRFIGCRSEISFGSSFDEANKMLMDMYKNTNWTLEVSPTISVDINNLRSRIVANLVAVITSFVPAGGKISISLEKFINSTSRIKISAIGRVKERSEFLRILQTKDIIEVTSENVLVHHASKMLSLAGNAIEIHLDENECSMYLTIAD